MATRTTAKTTAKTNTNECVIKCIGGEINEHHKR